MREQAWTAKGKWCGEGDPPPTSAALSVPHQCGRDDCGVFICAWCRRTVPWCFGCAHEDEFEALLCDACCCDKHAGEVSESITEVFGD